MAEHPLAMSNALDVKSVGPIPIPNKFSRQQHLVLKPQKRANSSQNRTADSETIVEGTPQLENFPQWKLMAAPSVGFPLSQVVL